MRGTKLKGLGTGEPGTTEPLKLTLSFLFPSHKQVGLLCCHWQDKLKGTAEPCCSPHWAAWGKGATQRDER